MAYLMKSCLVCLSKLFKINRKIVDIQRNFLKRLLLSKAGLVMISFKKFQSLPERKKDPKGYDKLLKF